MLDIFVFESWVLLHFWPYFYGASLLGLYWMSIVSKRSLSSGLLESESALTPREPGEYFVSQLLCNFSFPQILLPTHFGFQSKILSQKPSGVTYEDFSTQLFLNGFLFLGTPGFKLPHCWLPKVWSAFLKVSEISVVYLDSCSLQDTAALVYRQEVYMKATHTLFTSFLPEPCLTVIQYLKQCSLHFSSCLWWEINSWPISPMCTKQRLCDIVLKLNKNPPKHYIWWSTRLKCNDFKNSKILISIGELNYCIQKLLYKPCSMWSSKSS